MEHFSNKMFVEANMKAATNDIGRQAGTPERMLQMILNDDSIPQKEKNIYASLADEKVFSPTTKNLAKKNFNFQQ